MSTPTKNLTYLDGVFQGMRRDKASVSTMQFMEGSPKAMMPPFWKRLIQAGVSQSLAECRRASVRLGMELSKTIAITIFWRGKGGRPLQGQLWPLTR